MGVPIVYRKSAEGAIASYDYTNLAEGTGVIVYNGVLQATNAATSYILTSNTAMPSASPGTLADGQNVNFDLSAYNLPRVVKGTAYLTGECASAGNAIYVTATVKKLSGGAETNISSAVRCPDITVASGIFSFSISLTETVFKKGDILRLNITTPVAANTTLKLATDSTTKPFKFHVPYKIDI